MDVELARRQWEDGRRRIEAVRSDARRYRTMLDQVEIVSDELRKRVGQTFTMSELADAYAGADDWARHAVDGADSEEPPPSDLPAVAGAAFDQYARGATDYRP
jgi:hypothetical protein